MKTVDNSYRQDLPEFHIIDNTNMVRFTITGSWKGSYDNKLTIHKVSNSYEFKPHESELIPSETNDFAIAGKFGEALDPQHRPAPKLKSTRQADFISDDTS